MKAQLEALLQASEVTGLAAAWVQAGHPVDVYTSGELGGEPVLQDTVWTVASLTKPVFAYGIMQLVKGGLLDLNRPLQSYLPRPYLDDSVYVPQMTARHALSHTTGFPNWRTAEGLRAAYPPGMKFSYSSEGLTYLQYAAEQIIGMPMSAYLHEAVFTPLGMDHTQLSQETKSDLPPMLHFLQGSLLANGALSLRTTIADYARFMAAMLEDARETSEMLQPQIAIPTVQNLYWGLGWGLQTVESALSFWHWGARSLPTTMNFAMGIPLEQKAIVIFTNHRNGLALCQRIIDFWAGRSALPAFDWLLPAQDWRPDGKTS